ncbi:hypothetical protein [Sciscionella marina]|uniref:hypothetical protein n=1 Tax=Sciscionella marina TaxID=508770 RepID=UPI00036B23C8|nr:hypothetical protein [Sciscionella marina]
MPEPILISIAAALAGKAATGLYDLVRKKFSGDKEALAELEAATERPEDEQYIEAVAQRLDRAENDDAEFKTELRAEWEKIRVTQQAGDGSVNNQVSGDVGTLIQARDVHGDINL